jgi:hypothetical protein
VGGGVLPCVERCAESESGQPREPICHETASDRDVETDSPADHRNLDAFVDLGEDDVGNAVLFVTEQEDGSFSRGSKARQ